MIDPTGMHHYQPGYLYVALGQANGRWLVRDERSLLLRDVDLIIDRAIRIHPDAGTVQLERGASVEWDYLVIATGARLMHDRIPGLVEGAFGFYSGRCPTPPRGAAGSAGPDPRRHRRHPLQVPAGARRVRVHARGVPPQTRPSATEQRDPAVAAQSGLHDRVGEQVIQPILQERGIGLTTFFNVEQVDPAAHTVTSIEGKRPSTTSSCSCRRIRGSRS